MGIVEAEMMMSMGSSEWMYTDNEENDWHHDAGLDQCVHIGILDNWRRPSTIIEPPVITNSQLHQPSICHESFSNLPTTYQTIRTSVNRLILSQS